MGMVLTLSKEQFRIVTLFLFRSTSFNNIHCTSLSSAPVAYEKSRNVRNVRAEIAHCGSACAGPVARSSIRISAREQTRGAKELGRGSGGFGGIGIGPIA